MPSKSVFVNDNLVLHPIQAFETALVHVMEQPKPSPVSFLVARAVGSVGLAMSIVAIGLDWILPTPKVESPPPPPPPARRRSKAARRRSAPAELEDTLTRHSSRSRQARPRTPARATSLLTSNDLVRSRVHASHSTSRPSTPSRRSTDPSSILLPSVADAQQPKGNLPPPQPPLNEGSPVLNPSSASTLVATPALSPSVHILDTCDESLESDESQLSSRPKRRISSRLPRMKVFMTKARNVSSPVKPEITDKEVVDGKLVPAFGPSYATNITCPVPMEPVRSSRRSISVFVTPWTLSRSRTVSDVTAVPATARPTTPTSNTSRVSFIRRSVTVRVPPTSPAESPSSPAQVSPASANSTQSASYFTRKSDRRRSMPVARTQPYAYPYFAAMPTPNSPDDGLTPEQSVSPTRPRTSTELVHESDVERNRGRRSSKLNDVAQAALGLGRPSPKRRSASENLSLRSAPIQG
ncbi:hypothetical protein HGRIS_008342 [Hohenbuehelia grisea]|uniref:Uncharacterized protein n=1 Tax=Hohenbuehelia grisea TaxID=104357 RepID=A0ABR3J7N6_9AGAR